MATPAPSESAEINDAIRALERRVGSIERMFIDEEQGLYRRDDTVEEQKATLSTDLENVQSAINDLRAMLIEANQTFDALVSSLRSAVKKEEMERLTIRVDRLNFEKTLTKQGLKKALEHETNEQKA